MKATELMIGDWVEVILNSEKHFARVQTIDGYGDNATSNECVCDAIYYSIDELKPIPLTAEILEKNGFTREFVGDAYVLATDDFEVSVCFRRDSSVRALSVRTHTRIYEEKKITRAYAIHELQHALRLCGMNELADNFKI